MQMSEGCARETVLTEPHEGCARIEVSRSNDGAWLYLMRAADDGGEMQQFAWRFLIAPAVETERSDEYAPLYVAEYISIDEPGQPLYAVVAPVGIMPAGEVRMVAMIDCDDALREGPIPGVEEVHGEQDFERLCIAASRTAVREAARRALIENLSVLLSEHSARFVWIAPLDETRPQLMVEAR